MFYAILGSIGNYDNHANTASHDINDWWIVLHNHDNYDSIAIIAINVSIDTPHA